jgi:hypothetical protein
MKKNCFLILITIAGILCCGGCMKGYSQNWLHPEDVNTVYLEMFDNRSFWRGVEYKLTDALGKRIESQSPYKIVSDRDKADTIIGGQLQSVGQSVLAMEREKGRALEKEVILRAVVQWKDLRTGEILLNNKQIVASFSYSDYLNQDFDYGSSAAANKLADRIVEAMQRDW